MLRQLMIFATAKGAGGGGGSVNLLSGLVGAWKLDGDSNDSHGSNNGSDSSISYSTGKNGQCAMFSGAGSLIELVGSPLSGTGEFSIFCWVKCGNTKSGYPGLFACGSQSDSEAVFFALTPNKKLIASTYGLPYGLNGNTDVADDTWHQAGLIFKNGKFQLYLDGATDSAEMAFSPSLGNEYGWFGKLYNNGDTLEGYLEDMYVWNRALTASEITALYNSGNGNVYPF
jgi:hypothetical protein